MDKLTKSDILSGNRLIAKFIGLKWNRHEDKQLFSYDSVNKISFPILTYGTDVKCAEFHSNWQWLMFVVDKIENIGVSIDINQNYIRACWHYSKKKTVKYKRLGQTYKRENAFDSIGGEFYDFCIGIGMSAEKIKAETKILAVYMSCIKFIKWYNKNVKSKKLK